MHPETRPPPPVERLLREVEHLMAKAKEKDLGKNSIFSHDIERIPGGAIGFMEPQLFLALCDKYKIDETVCELIFLQATGRTMPHVPLKSGSAFLPLGAKHGYHNSKGGMYRGEYHHTSTTHQLKYKPAYTGEFFCAYPGDMHFFAPRNAAKFSAVAFTTPKLKQEGGNPDLLRFPESLVSVDEDHAIVIGN